MKSGVLHIYPQGAWHDDVLIVGDKLALNYLRGAVNAVLETEFNPSKTTTVYTNDGEGYGIHVLCLPEVPDNLAVPYTEGIAKERRKGAVWPWGLFKDKS